MALQKMNALFAAEFGAGEWAPAVDIIEDELAITIRAELPGVDMKDISVRVENNVLTLKGERRVGKEARKENFFRMERAYGVFTRSFALPAHVDATKVAADFKDGLLTVTLPRTESSKSRAIEIRAA